MSTSKQAEEEFKNSTSSRPPIREDLPSHQEQRRSHLTKRLSHLMDNVQSNIFIAGQRLNDLTGYSGIEQLKRDIDEQGKVETTPTNQGTYVHVEQLVQTTRNRVQEVKQAYTDAIAQRSASQREVNELLQRKHAWSPQDLERFTALYRSDHVNEKAETTAQEALSAAERAAEEASTKLGASILARYHEEQIWSDKIRRMSTWGTWGLMGVNVLLFLIFQIGVEPWRRRRLVKGFEDKVMEALEKEGLANKTATEAVLAKLHENEATLTAQKIPEASIPTEVVQEEPMVELLSGVDQVATEESSADQVTAEESSVDEVQSLVEAPRLWDVAIFTERAQSIIKHLRERLNDLFSDRLVTARRVDVTAATLEGVFAGIAVTSIIAAIIRGR